MDTGILGEPLSIEPDVSHADLAGSVEPRWRHCNKRALAAGRGPDERSCGRRLPICTGKIVLGGIGLGGAEGAVMSPRH